MLTGYTRDHSRYEDPHQQVADRHERGLSKVTSPKRKRGFVAKGQAVAKDRALRVLLRRLVAALP